MKPALGAGRDLHPAPCLWAATCCQGGEGRPHLAALGGSAEWAAAEWRWARDHGVTCEHRAWVLSAPPHLPFVAAPLKPRGPTAEPQVRAPPAWPSRGRRKVDGSLGPLGSGPLSFWKGIKMLREKVYLVIPSAISR